MNGERQLDFGQYEFEAREMSDDAIVVRISEIQATLDFADQLDRVQGSTHGGFYRDQIAVLRLELGKRTAALARGKGEDPLARGSLRGARAQVALGHLREYLRAEDAATGRACVMSAIAVLEGRRP
jgi:hypothetical protein